MKDKIFLTFFYFSLLISSSAIAECKAPASPPVRDSEACVDFFLKDFKIPPNASFDFCTDRKAFCATRDQKNDIGKCVKFWADKYNIDQDAAFKKCTQLIIQ
jgi:hypothetical protein